MARTTTGAARKPIRNIISSCCSTGSASRAARSSPGAARGRAASPAVRGRAVAHAMTAADFSDKWSACRRRERRLTGIRAAELADPAGEAQAIALALREALETPGRTAALVTPDRMLAARVVGASRRAGGSRPTTAPASPVANRRRNLAAGDRRGRGRGSGAGARCWPCSSIRWSAARASGSPGSTRCARLDLALRGPRPRGGLAGLDARISPSGEAERAWARLRPVARAARAAVVAPCDLADAAPRRSRACGSPLAGERAWRGPDGRMAAELLAELEAAPAPRAAGAGRGRMRCRVLRQLLDAASRSGRPMAAIRGSSSGACSKRGCSRPI